jgi:hypothetical protein
MKVLLFPVVIPWLYRLIMFGFMHKLDHDQAEPEYEIQ